MRSILSRGMPGRAVCVQERKERGRTGYAVPGYLRSGTMRGEFPTRGFNVGCVRGHGIVLTDGQAGVPIGGQVNVPAPSFVVSIRSLGTGGDLDGFSQSRHHPTSSIEACEGLVIGSASRWSSAATD